MTYPFADCCPNLPDADPGCDDGWCCTHETWHEAAVRHVCVEKRGAIVGSTADTARCGCSTTPPEAALLLPNALEESE